MFFLYLCLINYVQVEWKEELESQLIILEQINRKYWQECVKSGNVVVRKLLFATIIQISNIMLGGDLIVYVVSWGIF